ncbi:MAG: PilN domain-containing protein [candidate division Zixibacteria bacterium]
MDMIQINLLPKEFRKKTGGISIGKKGYYVIGGMAGVILMIAVISFYQMAQLSELDDKMKIARFRTQQLRKDIAVVDALIDVKEKIVKRMEAIDKLDQHRTVWVRILEDVSRRIPEFMWLSTFSEEIAKAPAPTDTTSKVQAQPTTRPVKIEGYAFTLNSLANFMIKIMRSNFFSDIEMASTEEVQFQEQKAYTFKINATLHYLSDEDLKKLLEEESGPKLLAGF